MGGFYYYQQMLDILDEMATLYPNLITARQEVAEGNTTEEGRPLWYVKISDNPSTNETEPEVLYTAVHHAREPMSMTQMIYYMWYLLENYNNNDRVTGLVNETEMYFIPCLNPDGYIYNQTTNPTGGGLWRKNRFVTDPDTIGVDLNRNYGYNWGIDDFGSSPDKLSETYRGTEPFSEAETKMVREFVNNHNFLATLNYHSFSNLLIFPWGYGFNTYTPDSAQYSKYGKILTWYNIYKFGTTNQTLNYYTNGGSDDWMYGEQDSKPKIFSFTPEVGSYVDGFWPMQSRILPLCKENIFTNITTASMVGKFAVVNDMSEKWVNQSNYASYKLEQFGMDTTGTFTVGILPVKNISSVGVNKIYSNLFLMQELNDSISFVHTAALIGDTIQYILEIDNGLYKLQDTVTRIFGGTAVAYSNNCENIDDFIVDNFWGTSSDYFVSPPSSITDSPDGEYFSNNLDYITIVNPIDLSDATDAMLTFYARWMLEARGDAVTIEASTDDFNIERIPLCGKYTVTQTIVPDFNYPIYEGFQPTWVQEQISLYPFVGSNNLKIRFAISTDNSVEYDGFYFDDFKVEYTIADPSKIAENSSVIFTNAIPNPARKETTIYYKVPSNAGSIAIFDVSGKIVFSENLGANEGSILIDVSEFGSGLYFYQLKVDGVVFATKKLMVE